jgi:parvulin-like peptidyl-prolyl isomerase
MIFYKGSRHAPAFVTRPKDEARARAEEAAAKARTAGVRFDDVASEYTEEPKLAAKRVGEPGTIHPSAMVPEFRAALLALRVGEVSGVVETVFGFYVILRTE